MTVQAYNTRLDEMRYPILAETIKYNVDGRRRLIDNPRAVANFMADEVGLMRLVMIGAVTWIAVHNHPSGDATPSKMDEKVTETLKRASEIMGIQLLDHIIIGDDEYKSFREEGLM